MQRSHLIAAVAPLLLAAAVNAQQTSPAAPPTTSQPDLSDPASPSSKLVEALDMIRRVEEYDKLATELARLQAENERLKQTIAQLQNELTKQTTDLPVITVKSKVIGRNQMLAVLAIGEKTMRVRQNSEVVVPQGQGEPTTMRVLEIAGDSVKIEFPELNRTLVLYE